MYMNKVYSKEFDGEKYTYYHTYSKKPDAQKAAKKQARPKTPKAKVVRAESVDAPHTFRGEICIKSERKSKYVGRKTDRRK